LRNKLLPKSLYTLGTIAISMSLLVACGTDKTMNNVSNNEKNKILTPQKGGTITVGIPQEPDTLDLQKAGMSISDNIGGNLGGGLLTQNPKTLEIEPYLAKDYKVSEDGKTITITLKKNIKLHDGTPLTAQVFKDTYERILDPKTGSVVALTLLAGLKTITVVDDYTLVFGLEKPSATFLVGLTSEGYLHPMSMKAVKKYGKDYGRHPVGAGPWKFKEWQTGQSITLVRNEDFNWPQGYYKNKGIVYPDELKYKVIKDYQTMLAALDSNSIDIALNISSKDVPRYQNNKNFKVFEQEKQGLGLMIEMNTETDKLKDLNVRKALNMLIDKDAIIKAVLNGAGKPAYGPLPPSINGYDKNVEDYGYKLNKEEALKLFKNAGYKKNKDGYLEKNGKELTLELTLLERLNQAGQMVQAMFKDAGIKLKLKTMEAAALIQSASQGQVELAMATYTYPDPDVLYLLFHSSQIGGFNYSRANNKELDALLEKGRVTMDMEKRKKIYAEAQKIIIDNGYIIPIYNEKIFHVVNNRVQDVNVYQDILLLNDSWVKK